MIGCLMTTKRENGRKWDGISRVSTAQYKKNYDTIFKPKRLTTTIPPLRGPLPQGLPLKKYGVIKQTSGLKNGRYSGR